MSTNFDITPQKEGQLLSFIRRQIFYVPDEVKNVDLKGKTAIVTGSNIGIGFACCQHFLDLGLSKLILAVRDEEKGHAAAVRLAQDRDISPGAIDVWLLDLQRYGSVQAFAERARSLEQLDIIVLNAAIMPIKQELNASTGHDESIQVNYLSTALLAILLLQVIKDGGYNHPTRMTVVSTDAAAWTRFKEKENDPLLASLDKPDNWDPIDRHFVSKLLMQLFVAELAPFVPASLAVINMATPGLVYDTEVTREARTIFIGKVAAVMRRIVGYTSPVGARLVVDAAVNHTESHGQYLSEKRIKPMAPIVYAPEGAEVRARLWKETLAELSFANVEKIIAGLGNYQKLLPLGKAHGSGILYHCSSENDFAIP